MRRVAPGAVDPRLYLDGANLCFGEWGDEAMFAWAFRGDAELLFVEDAAGKTIAATGITWRNLRTGQRASIMTGSWTLPEARGLGAFSAMLEEIRSAASDRNAMLLGFGRAENASARRFDAAGAQMHPTFYCRSTVAPVQSAPLEQLDPEPEWFPSSFRYTPAEWRTQFLDRPDAAIECLGRRGAWAAVVERAPQFDRVHAVSRADALPQLAARAHAEGRRLFWYATRPPEMECEWTDGFLAILPPVITEWELQNGDRM
jgi:GNAT superfamily N-acetyltransferase